MPSVGFIFVSIKFYAWLYLLSKLNYVSTVNQSLLLYADIYFFCTMSCFIFQIQMKVAWNLKGGGITGFTMAEDELPILCDVYSSVIQSGCQKASYIVQFVWRGLTSGYDMIGPYFPVPNSMDANTLQQFFMLCLKSFSAYGFHSPV